MTGLRLRRGGSESLVAGAALVVVEHVLCDGHEHALVTLDAVACFNLRCGEDRDGYRKYEGHDAERLGRKDAAEPFAEVLVQDDD